MIVLLIVVRCFSCFLVFIYYKLVIVMSHDHGHSPYIVTSLSSLSLLFIIITDYYYYILSIIYYMIYIVKLLLVSDY